MKRALVLPFILAALPLLAAPISDATAEGVMQAANRIKEATLSGDVETIAGAMHPKLVRLMGGEEAALGLVEQAFEMTRSSGLEITEYEILRPTDLYETETEQVVFVPNKSVVSGSGVTLRSTGYLIASRPVGGDEWVFIDGAGIEDPRAIHEIFPGLPEEISIPEQDREVVQE